MEVGCKSIKQQKQRSRMLSALMEVCNGAVERMQQDEHNHNNDAPDDSLSNETVAVKMQPDQDTAAVKEATGSTRCRSLLCDANGTFVAELVYRCLMCNALHEQASDAQSHYLNRHTCTSNSIALLQRPANEEEEDEDEKRSDAMSSDADLEEDIDFHIKRRKAQHTDNRSFGRTLPVSDNHRVPDPTTLTNRRTMNAMDSRLSSDSGTYSGSQMLMADESFDDARSSPTSSEAATPLDDRQGKIKVSQ